MPRHASEYDPDDLVTRKAAQDLRISVCLPARHEEATVGHIVATVRRTLMEAVPLVDAVGVIADRSSDATAEAAELGALDVPAVKWDGHVFHGDAELELAAQALR